MLEANVDKPKEALREKAVELARKHKASWIELGQCLFSVHRDKLYKGWGYLTFEAYCQKDLGIKQATAAKLLRSYSYLEKEEPRLIRAAETDDVKPAAVPHYESVNLLRLAKENESIPSRDFEKIRDAVLVSAKEPKEVRAQVKKILSEQAGPEDPAEARRMKRNSAVKRVMTVLQMAKKELEHEKLLPDYLLKQMNDLLEKLKDQVEGE